MTAPPTSSVRLSRCAAIVLTIIALGTGCTAPPLDPPTSPARSGGAETDATPSADDGVYVALGDSYAAGMGGGEYLDSCLRSPNGYAAALAGEGRWRHVELRGCSGATTDDVIASQLDALDDRTGTVTLTVGANDLGVRALGEACFSGTPDVCSASVEAGLARLGGLSADLVALFGSVRTAAPEATVVVTGYPLLVESPRDDAEAAVNEGMAMLNDVIEAAVAAAGPGFAFVDVEGAFAGHRIGSPDPWIIAPPDDEAFHPNPAGYSAYAEAIRAAR